MERKFKPETHFSHAYEAWVGEKWQWSVDGVRNCPMESGDPEVVAFYMGFNFAKKGQVKTKNLKKEIEKLKSEFKERVKHLESVIRL